jgi:flagellar basal body rod protein FlgG
MIQSLSSGMQAQWYRQEALANNLANVATVGFKQDSLTLKQGTIEAGPGGTMVVPRTKKDVSITLAVARSGSSALKALTRPSRKRGS